MIFLQSKCFSTQEELDKLSKEYTERCNQPVTVLPCVLEEVPPKVFYICDRLLCENCNRECKHTSDITHAVNFAQRGGHYWEVHV